MSEEQKKEEEEQHYEMIKVNNPQRQNVPKDTRNNYPINFLINLIQIIILCHYGLNDIPGCDNRLKDYMHTLAIYHILLFLYPLIILGIIIFVYCAGGNREGLARIHYIYTVIFIAYITYYSAHIINPFFFIMLCKYIRIHSYTYRTLQK